MGLLWLMIAVDVGRELGADDRDKLSVLVLSAAHAHAVRELVGAALARRDVRRLDLVVRRTTGAGAGLRVLLLRNCHGSLS